jgi:hypothetical protein
MKSKMAAIVAADIAGYSKLIAEDEEKTLRRLAVYRAVFSDFITQFSGNSQMSAMVVWMARLTLRAPRGLRSSMYRRIDRRSLRARGV